MNGSVDVGSGSDSNGLHTTEWGRGRRVVLAHGFTQNAACWGPFGHDLAADHQVVAVDLPGHGSTPACYDDADLDHSGRLLMSAGGRGVYIGYSMGGRIALHGALARPEQVLALVLIGATAGIDDAGQRAERRDADGELADQLETGGVDRFLDRWLANPLFAGLSERVACRPQRATNRAEGLAASLRRCGSGNQQPLWARLDRLTMPALVLAGSRDDKFMQLGRRLVERLPDASLRTLPATHAVQLEQPTATAEMIRQFLDDHLGPL